MDAVPGWQSSTLTPTRTYGSRYPGAELQLHDQQPAQRAEERAERLAEAGGRRLHRLPPTTEKVWLKHSWKLSDGAQWDAALLQYAGRERCDANVDGTHTRAEWHNALREDWQLAAEHSAERRDERRDEGSFELAVHLHQLAPDVTSLFVVLSASGGPIRTQPRARSARLQLLASAGGVEGEAALLCDGRAATDGGGGGEETALVLARLRRPVSAGQGWSVEELGLQAFGRVGISSDHYSPIYAALEAWLGGEEEQAVAEEEAERARQGQGRLQLPNGDVYAGEWLVRIAVTHSA